MFAQYYFVCTVFSPINGHSKRRTPLISGQNFPPIVFWSKSDKKMFLKVETLSADTLINGQYFLHKIVNLAFFPN